LGRFIRPGAIKIGLEHADNDLMATAAKNPDGSIAVVVFNEGLQTQNFKLELDNQFIEIVISPQAIQTIVITK